MSVISERYAGFRFCFMWDERREKLLRRKVSAEE